MKYLTLTLIVLTGIVLSSPAVRAESSDEEKAIAVLQSGAGPAEKEAACLRLKQIATAKAIPALISLLSQEHMDQWALDVLETLPGAEAGEALTTALGTTSGKTRAAVANALGIRREARALPGLIALLADADSVTAGSAAKAVGRIGGPEAVAGLKKAAATPSPAHAAIVDALLDCADRLLAQKDAQAASALYQELYGSKEPDHVRVAAYRGVVLSAGDAAVSRVVEGLKVKDTVAQLACVELVRELPAANATAAFAALLTETAPLTRIGLLEALGQRGDATAADAVAAAALTPDPAVRLAAVRALVALGKTPPVPAFRKLRLSDQFYAEGAYYGDFNKDGKMDVVAGPFWFEGPDFQKKHQIREPKVYDPNGYSDNFLTYTADFNGDGWTDVFYVPFPSAEGYWYENPAGKDEPWKRHLAYTNVSNESPVWGDVNDDDRPELIFNIEGYLGYATYDPKKPDQPWVFHAVSTQDKRYQKFTHGVGFGDINGDKRVDLVEAVGWWEQPAEPKEGQPWAFHPFHFADAAAQILVADVDGDGLNDVITAWHCHHYGLVWYKQLKDRKGQINWKQNVILSPTPDLNSKDLRVSQLHAFALVDVNGDGLPDIVTGKRFWAHGPKGDKEPDAPAVVLWFELRRDARGGVTFVPHLIDDDSGVGTQVEASDLNGDGIPDVIVGNKKGIFVHLSKSP